MAGKNNADWASRFNRSSTAATDEPEAAPATPPARTKTKPAAVTAPAATRVAKVAATYRFEPDVLELVEAAVHEAAGNGQRLSREAAVSHAIRQVYGHLAD